MLIPGEALQRRSQGSDRWLAPLQRIDAQRAVWATTVRLAAYLVLVCVTWWTVTWWTESPTIDNTCVRPPVGPGVDYSNGAWTYNGHIIGYTATEDDGCLSTTPL